MARAEAVAGGVARSQSQARRRLSENVVSWILLAPGLVALGLFVFAPMVDNVFVSLRDQRLTSIESPYVGLDNWERLLDDGTLWSSLRFTLLYTAITVSLSVLTALTLALALMDRKWLRRIVGTIILAPIATSLVVSSAGWRLFFDIDGALNEALTWVGIEGPNWLNEPTTAKVAIIAVGFWSMTGFSYLLYQAALSHVPRNIRDAGRVFGAWERRGAKFRLIAPLMHRTTAVATIVTTIIAIKAFDQVYALTQGGPAGATRTLAFLSWEQSFLFYNLGAGAVAACILVALVLCVTAVEFAILAHFDRRGRRPVRLAETTDAQV
jgi:ABC-type sugar transport system permease subunit